MGSVCLMLGQQTDNEASKAFVVDPQATLAGHFRQDRSKLLQERRQLGLYYRL